MTNRQWLSTISDEEFLSWLYEHQSVEYYEDHKSGEIKAKVLGNYNPTLWEITCLSNQSRSALLNWFKAKRQEPIINNQEYNETCINPTNSYLTMDFKYPVDTKIEELNMSNVLYNHLKKNGINNVFDLLTLKKRSNQ